MNKRRMVLCLLFVGLLLAGTVSFTQAQNPSQAEDENVGAPSQAATVSGRIPVQGRLTNGSGAPLDGTYSITFRLYGQSSGGAAVCSDTNSVQVENGLFTSEIWGDCGSSDMDGRQLYLGIEVESDGEMTPRQPIRPVPYAFSLKPGVIISSTSSNAVIHAENYHSSGRGLRGYALSESGSNFGVVGASRSPDGYGGYFYNTSESPNTGVAVAGYHPTYGLSDLSVWARPAGYFAGRIGVTGLTKDSGGYGVFGLSNHASGWAGFFSSSGNGVRISVPPGKTGLEVASGTKNAVVATDDGARQLYSEESTGVWFSDYGFGQLDGGATTVSIDSIYAQTVNLEEPYHVFLQVYGDADVYVTERTPTSFDVRLREGDGDIEFSYRIVARRLGYETDRLERSPWADDDPNLFPVSESGPSSAESAR